MASQVGISDAQAHKLIELAKKHGLTAKVRTFRKNSSQHAGRAFLFEVTSPGYARIQPLTHRKEEIVELSTLRLWKSGNDFDTQEVYDMEESPEVFSGTGEAITTTTRYVIFSKAMIGVWSESRTNWTQNIKNASKWNVNESTRANQILQKLRKAPVHNDAELITEMEAVVKLQNTLLEKNSLLEKKIMNTSPVAVTKPSFSSIPDDDDDDDFLDLEALHNVDDTLLRQAENDRKKILEEYAVVKKTFRETRLKLKGLNEKVVNLGGRSILKSENSNPNPKKESKRVYLRFRIKSVLLNSSRLDAKAIFERLSGNTPSLTLQKLKQSLITMGNDGLAEKDENNGWSLTGSGRTSKMIGE